MPDACFTYQSVKDDKGKPVLCYQNPESEYTAKDHVDVFKQAGIDVSSYPSLLVYSLLRGIPEIPTALVDAGIPLRIAYEAPEYDEVAEYRDNISKEFHEM